MSCIEINCQNYSPQSLGLRHLQTVYKKDTVDILIQSKKGEENILKPIFLFIQGSLPRPLIMYDSAGVYPIVPFKADSLLNDYHLVVIGKPRIPLIADSKNLTDNFSYINPLTKQFPSNYINRNYLDYYVNRDLYIIQYLQKQKFINNKKCVVTGHSEGSTIAAKMAASSKIITHLIYLSGNPFGRIMSIIEDDRKNETDSMPLAENDFNYWQEVAASPDDMHSTGDTYKATYSFSIPPVEYLEKLSIPVFIAYGTNDYCSPFNDYVKVDMIRQHKTNFTFKAYIGLDHNFFPLLPNGDVNYAPDNWSKVALDFYHWLGTNKD